MKTLLTVLLAFVLFVTPSFGADLSQERACGLKFGKTGNDLPNLLKEGIKVLPQKYGMETKQFVYVENMGGLLDCYGVKDSKVREDLTKNHRAFVIGNSYPVYFNGELPVNQIQTAAFRADPLGQAYLKYMAASYAAHEWLHASGETKEFPAYSFEYEILNLFKNRMPNAPEIAAYFSWLKTTIAEVRKAEESGKTLVISGRTNQQQ